MPVDAMKICKKCGETKPTALFGPHHTTKDRLRPECKACRVISARLWAQANKDKRAASTKRARAKNPEAFRLRKRADNAKNHAARRETARAWTEKNRARVMAQNLKWQVANREKYLMAIRVCNQRKRGRGPITKDMIESLNVSQKNRCVVCRIKLGIKFHLDHIMPLARGGGNAVENLQLLCPPCNQQKKDRHPVEFMQSKGLLL